MGEKKILRIGLAAVVVLALALAAVPLLSKLYWHRSLGATIFSWQLHKERYTTAEVFEEYLAQKREENSAEYTLPEAVAEEIAVTEANPAGMRFYLLGGGENGTSDTETPVIIYLPGGSYIDQPGETHWRFLDALAEDTGALVAVPIYPKLPDNDAETAVAALTEACGAFLEGREYSDLIFMGDSAGGGLALSLAMRLRDLGETGPDKLVLICPWLDVTLVNPEIPAYEKRDPALDAEQLRHLGVLWAGSLPAEDPLVSPLYGSFEGLGEITLVTGTAELLYPDIRRMHETLAAQGIGHNYLCREGMFHVFPLFSVYNIPEARAVCGELTAIIRE